MDEQKLIEENERLKAENERLRNQLRNLRRQLDSYIKQSRRQYEQDVDYIPHDDYRE